MLHLSLSDMIWLCSLEEVNVLMSVEVLQCYRSGSVWFLQ